MKRIASFEVNHDKLKPGMYTSRIDGDVTTYDIRMVHPNAGTYIEPAAGHTFEHLFATFARNSDFQKKLFTAVPWAAKPDFIFWCGIWKRPTRSRWRSGRWRSSPAMKAGSQARAASSAAITGCTIWRAQKARCVHDSRACGLDRRKLVYEK